MNYLLMTLGCPKNTVDSEGMHGILVARGHTPVAELRQASVIIVNTCSFIAAAREETLDVLRSLGKQKRRHQRLIAAGCMAESHNDLVRTVPGVDAVLSTRQWMQIGDLVEQVSDQPASAGAKKKKALPVLELEPLAVAPDAQGYADWRSAQIRRMENGPSAYLKISDGCNLRCAFCTIPSFKGDMRSKPVGAVVGEARALANNGVREIVLVAQHLTDYGRDLGLHDGLALLLDELCGVLPPDIWLRLMYAYPHGVSQRLIDTMARHPQICAYLDMPLQHAHPATLRRMRRPPDTERTRATLAALREAMPDIALRSTFIVGYPGETEHEFQALLDFLSDIQFEKVGAFQYSQEPGTPAASLPDQVPPPVIERRWHTLMQHQQGIALARNQLQVGRTLDVLVEGHGSTETGETLLVGRTFRDAPEIDGQVLVWGQAPIGSRVHTRITHATEYDLWGEEEPEPLMMNRAASSVLE